MNHPENKIQEAFVKSVRQYLPRVLFTISPVENAGVKEATRRKRMGYLKGTPDLTFHEPRGRYHGLFIEAKAPGGTLSDEQKEFKELAESRGYCYKSYDNAGDMFKALVHYLALADVIK